ncbi:hypothetical protein K438DRAFT_1764934 [Mycena galopus ATCC 62051]|nr:hypothetical protein K438DRAFT_1764934 [Mycena galopus ATCC 62051]
MNESSAHEVRGCVLDGGKQGKIIEGKVNAAIMVTRNIVEGKVNVAVVVTRNIVEEKVSAAVVVTGNRSGSVRTEVFPSSVAISNNAELGFLGIGMSAIKEVVASFLALRNKWETSTSFSAAKHQGVVTCPDRVQVCRKSRVAKFSHIITLLSAKVSGTVSFKIAVTEIPRIVGRVTSMPSTIDHGASAHSGPVLTVALEVNSPSSSDSGIETLSGESDQATCFGRDVGPLCTRLPKRRHLEAGPGIMPGRGSEELCSV